MAVLKNSLDKMIKLLLPKIQFTEKTNLHIYLASDFTNVHNDVQFVLRRLYRQFILHSYILLDKSTISKEVYFISNIIVQFAYVPSWLYVLGNIEQHFIVFLYSVHFLQ